jgi:hypothetical protein
MRDLQKTIKDYKYYLDEMGELAKPLPKKKQAQLADILATQITLLVALKNHSSLGQTDYSAMLKVLEK